MERYVDNPKDAMTLALWHGMLVSRDSYRLVHLQLCHCGDRIFGVASSSEQPLTSGSVVH
jgi:hypothetical protein